MSHAALFLDRDGTINHDPGYIRNPDDIILYPGVVEGIRQLKNKFRMKMIVISNQSGIARGMMTHEDVKAINNRINEILLDSGTSIDGFYYCPYHPDYSEKHLTNCRKPSPELVFLAEKEHDIDLSKSYFIGDKVSDVDCGINAGVKTIFLKNELNKEEIISLKKGIKTPNFVACNFSDACEFIINDFTEAGS
jgi:D,D-heptose 1,7-bisphosphate phosphatase